MKGKKAQTVWNTSENFVIRGLYIVVRRAQPEGNLADAAIAETDGEPSRVEGQANEWCVVACMFREKRKQPVLGLTNENCERKASISKTRE